MTLGTHATAATAIGFFIPGPWWLGWFLSFLSHFLLDAIPHYDYDEKRGGKKPWHFKINEEFTVNVLKIAVDLVLGLLIPLAIAFWFNLSYIYILGCAILAMAPDFLHPIHLIADWKIFRVIQRFHVWIHNPHKIKRPLFGYFQQGLIIIFFISLIFYF